MKANELARLCNADLALIISYTRMEISIHTGQRIETLGRHQYIQLYLLKV
jgi:hypothetical protein